MKKTNLAELYDRLCQSGIDINFGPELTRLSIQMWQLLAERRPVSPEQLEQLACRFGISRATLTNFLSRYKGRFEFDAEGNVVGWSGLSLNPSSHRLQVNGCTVFAWCAWDTLFLPPFLRQTALVEASCPATGEMIRLTVTPERVAHYEPRNAVISLVVPETSVLGVESVEGVRGAFCSHVRFFSSPDAVSSWFTGKSQQPIVLSIEEGYQLGHMRFEKNTPF